MGEDDVGEGMDGDRMYQADEWSYLLCERGDRLAMRKGGRTCGWTSGDRRASEVERG